MNGKVKAALAEVDPACDFVIKNLNGERIPVRMGRKSETNCTLYDPDDVRIDKARFELMPASGSLKWELGVYQDKS